MLKFLAWDWGKLLTLINRKMEKMTMDEWIVSDDTGISSKTIWAALKIPNIKDDNFRFDVPSDNSDFRRCYRLVKNCEITKENLQKVSEALNWYKPIIDNWDKLSELYENEKQNELYNLLKKLGNEVREIRNQTSVSLGKGITMVFNN